MLLKFSADGDGGDRKRVSPGDAILGLGATVAGVRGATKVGDKLNEIAYRHMQNLGEKGALVENRSAEAAERIAKKMGLSPNVTHYTIDDPVQSFFVPEDTHIVDRKGRRVGTSFKRQEAMMPYFDEMRKARKEGNLEEVERLKRKALQDFENTTEGAIAGVKSSDLYLHEAGHATGLMHAPKDAGKLRRLLSNKYSRGVELGNNLLFGTKELAASHPNLHKALRFVPGGIAAARQVNKEMTGDDNLVLQGADYAGRGLTGLKLFEEAQASARPIYHIAREEGLKSALKATHHLGTGFASYLAPAVAAHVLAPLAVKGAFAANRAILQDKADEPARPMPYQTVPPTQPAWRFPSDQ